MIKTTKRQSGNRRVQLDTGKKTKVEQSHRDSVNINTIMLRTRKTGMMPIAKTSGLYGDFSGVTDFQGAHNLVLNAQKSFLELPSVIRNRFQNNPGALIQFLNDPKNESEAREMGLLPQIMPEQPPQPKPDTDPQPVPDTESK